MMQNSAQHRPSRFRDQKNNIEEEKEGSKSSERNVESFDIDLSSECIEEGFKIAVEHFSRFNKVLHVNCLKNVTDRN
jgi:hypothetical protein